MLKLLGDERSNWEPRPVMKESRARISGDNSRQAGTSAYDHFRLLQLGVVPFVSLVNSAIVGVTKGMDLRGNRSLGTTRERNRKRGTCVCKSRIPVHPCPPRLQGSRGMGYASCVCEVRGRQCFIAKWFVFSIVSLSIKEI